MAKQFQTSADKLKRLPHAVEAPFNAYIRQHEPFCLPSTRTALLEAIYDWTDAQDERCLYWLSGLAGTGKSTIARTVARRLNDQRRLGASFFFSKGGGDVSHAGKFVTSIAVQLASHVPGIHQHLADVLKKFPNISSLSLRDQWRHLVLDFSFAPALTIDASSVILVVDALDECDNGDDIGRIIELLAEARDLDGLRLRILVTSRPEVPIRHGFESFDHMSSTLLQRYVLHRIAPNIVNADIALFLSHNLKTIGKQQYLTANWPGAKVIATMTERASGLFVWAATACRFIQKGRRFAERRLKSIMKDDVRPMEPEKHLDNLYLTVLRDSLSPEYSAEEKEDHCKMLRLVLGTLTILHVPLSVQALEKASNGSSKTCMQSLICRKMRIEQSAFIIPPYVTFFSIEIDARISTFV
ncbi:uncharacterized protein J4E92_009278 [Alternaria infectoria]|uniref:uncharacterized protein n=1 Tax=Alternaria infectoria TaxID=45303 RepID=UPI002220C1ED|nr:uncharacterized protein J4E92_009278 [Alternaria infectoria]KAI4916361.1 hypothetical protein J4E92_009278 [Alternaria infectoria]